MRLVLLLICSMVAGCSDSSEYEIGSNDFLLHIKLIESFSDPLQQGLAEWNVEQTECTVTLIKDEYPRCLQHEVRHCIEGHWHPEEQDNSEDCFR